MCDGFAGDAPAAAEVGCPCGWSRGAQRWGKLVFLKEAMAKFDENRLFSSMVGSVRGLLVTFFVCSRHQ